MSGTRDGQPCDFSKNSELIARAQNGDREAMECVIELNMGLVKSIAPRFCDRGVEYDDLVQIGSLGMIKAVKSYSEGFGCVFSTYAVPLIIGEIRRYLRDDGMIKVSRGVKRLGVHAMKQRELYIKEKGREPKIEELAEICGSCPEELVFALEACYPHHSLSEPAGDGNGVCLENVIPDKNDGIESLCDRISLKDAIKKLSDTERQIIHLRYYCDLSQQKTAEVLGLSQVKVSRCEKKIFEKLKGELLV